MKARLAGSWVTNTKEDAWVSWERWEGEDQCQYEAVQTVVFGEQEMGKM